MPVWVALIGAGVSAGVGAYSASRQADAATQASGVQVASSDRAAALQYAAAQDTLAFQKQQWASAQTMAQPWVQAGQGAVSKLSGLMGIGGVSPSGWAPQTPIASSGTAGIPASAQSGSVPYNGYGQVPTWAQSQQADSPSAPSTSPGRTQTTDWTPGKLNAPALDDRAARRAANVAAGRDPNVGSGTPTSATTSTTTSAAASATAGTTVTMRSPGGTEQNVPAEYVSYYEQLGAVRV